MQTVYKTRSPKETVELGAQLASRLEPGISVLLFGDLGSGKTQFVKGIAKGLGIKKIIKSPTFAYVNKYQIKSGSLQLIANGFFHYDLYRLQAGEDLESIGLMETMHDGRSINVVEWADRMAGFAPKEYVRVDFKVHADHHEIVIWFEDPEILPDELIDKYLKDWATPTHVQAHCKEVTNVCLQIGRALVSKNIFVNLDLLYGAGMLHDLARVADFQGLDRDKFHEKVTEEKWVKWVDQQKKYAGHHHADVAAKILAEDGYLKTAELIRMHNSLTILEEPDKLEASLEAAILFYADKRVKHDEAVSLTERFRDGRERHGKYDDPRTREKFDEVEKRTYALERRLFALIDLKPEDIK